MLCLAGCGGGDDGAQVKPTATPDDERAVAKTVGDYFEAVADADAAAMCATLTADLQRDVLAQEGAPCPEAVAPELEDATEAQRRDLRSVRVLETTVDGDRATASLTSDERLAGTPDPVKVQLRRGPSGWRIAERPPPPTLADRCAKAGLDAFDAGSIHPFWKRQGREALALYLSRLCYVGQRRGLVTAKGTFDSTARGKRELANLSADIIDELVAEGRMRDPEGSPQPDRLFA